MIKVIVADDEDATRNRVLSYLGKHPELYEILGTYENGYDALEAASSFDAVDLLVTDIKMPFVTGLELAKEMKEMFPLLEVIIISGFDDFDFAKQAIALDAVSYLSKPLSFDELEEALQKALSRLTQKQSVFADQEALKEEHLSLLKAEKNADLLRLLTIKEPGSVFLNKLERDGIELKGKKAAFLLFDPDKEEENINYEEMERVHLALENLFEEAFEGANFSFHPFEQASSFGVLLLSDKESFSPSFLERRLSALIASIKRNLGLSFSCAISELDSDQKDPSFSFRKLYRHCLWALEYRTIMGEGLVLFYKDLANYGKSIGKVDENDYKDIANALLYGKKEEAMRLIAALIERVSTPEYKDSYFLILNNLFDAILKSCIAIDRFYDGYKSHLSLVNDLYQRKGKEGVQRLFEEIAGRVVEINSEKRSQGLDSSYVLMERYIDEHFRDSGLSVDDLSKAFGYSTSYVFAILKKHETSFTKLLTARRMAEAKRLLSNPKSRMAEVASEIGYEDPYYFSHCFKKYFGISPLEYKKG